MDAAISDKYASHSETCKNVLAHVISLKHIRISTSTFLLNRSLSAFLILEIVIGTNRQERQINEQKVTFMLAGITFHMETELLRYRHQRCLDLL